MRQRLPDKRRCETFTVNQMQTIQEAQKAIKESGVQGRVYIAGPMSGIPEYNFPAFHAAAKRWRAQDWEVVNPAELDEQIDGFDAKKDAAMPHEHYMRRDIPQVATCDAIALLPGWENSRGANDEITVGRMCGLAFYDAETGEPYEFKCKRDNLLNKTERVVYGARQKDYGDAKTNHENIARIWSVTLGIEVTYQQVIQCMVGVKLARLANSPDHEDSYIDIAGYAAVWDKAQHSE